MPFQVSMSSNTHRRAYRYRGMNARDNFVRVQLEVVNWHLLHCLAALLQQHRRYPMPHEPVEERRQGDDLHALARGGSALVRRRRWALCVFGLARRWQGQRVRPPPAAARWSRAATASQRNHVWVGCVSDRGRKPIGGSRSILENECCVFLSQQLSWLHCCAAVL